MPDSDSRDRNRRYQAPVERQVQPRKCTCGCQPEVVYAAELHRDFARLLPELDRLGDLNCFARNHACVLGRHLAMPALRHASGYHAGASTCAEFHLDTSQWEHVYLVHENHREHGVFMGLEFYDRHHRALFRTFLTPDAEQRELQSLVNLHYLRTVPLDELNGWQRMGRLTGSEAHLPTGLTPAFAAIDPLSSPFDGKAQTVSEERGYDGTHPLAWAVLSAAEEDEQALDVVVSGAFGRMRTYFTPRTVGRLTLEWMFAGESASSLRLNLAAVGTYWIGQGEQDGRTFSYLEAVDAFGDLIVRLASAEADSFRYWQALAAGM